MSRIAVLGGTFDPVHLGHVTIAEQVREALGAGEAWLVPAGQPPVRDQPVASPERRLAMVRAALTGHQRLRALDIEVRRPGPSYTYDTLGDLRALDPEHEYWLIVGADVAPSVSTWHRAAELLELANFAIVNRSGSPSPGPSERSRWGFTAARTMVLAVDSPRISAMDVRSRVAAGLPIDRLVPEPVAALISELGLYKLR